MCVPLTRKWLRRQECTEKGDLSAAVGAGEPVPCRNEPAIQEKIPEKGWR